MRGCGEQSRHDPPGDGEPTGAAVSPRLPVSVHIGISSGIALIGPTKYEGTSGACWTYTAFGPAVNLAARIAGVAEGGVILVGPETARRIEGQFSTKEIGKKQLKNVKGEVTLYQVMGKVDR